MFFKNNRFGKVVVTTMNLINVYKKFRATMSSVRYVRYLRSKGMSIGENTVILAPRHTYFDEGRADFISIGSGGVICKNTSFIAHDYSWSVLRKKYNIIAPTGGGPITIGNNVFIGEGTTVLRNVKIGDNVIIGAGSVVTKNIPSDCIAAGNPAKVIMTIEEYKNKREATLLTEAKKNAVFLYEKYKVVPSENKMKNFRVLYMPRTEETNKQYLRENGCLGDSSEEFIKTLNEQKPIYSSYEEFINDMLSDVL